MSSHALVVDRKAQRSERRESEEPVRRDRTVVALTPRSRAAVQPLGGEPRVSLLPAEVNDFHRARAVRQRLGGAVVAVVALVMAGVAGTYFLSVTATAALDTATATSQQLIAQEAGFTELRQVQSGIALVHAGQKVGAATEVDWQAYLLKLQGTLPTGVSINSVAIEGSTPFADFVQSTIPLEGSRVATLSFTAVSPTLPSIQSWLDGLAKLPGFADAVPGSVLIQENGTYIVNITMHINADAFSERFGDKK